MTTRFLIWLIFPLILISGQVFAQSTEPAVLIADRMYIQTDGLLVAEGNVEAHQGDIQMTARKVTYDQEEDVLQVFGPIRLTNSDGKTTVFADEAAMDPQLVNGLMLGARLVLDRQLQLAAVELNRSEGRYTHLYKVAATSCQICGDQTPIWQIRAKEVVHDAEERQLYFTNAQFVVFDLPIVVVPKLRVPDPTRDRATGFLIPYGRSSSVLGSGFKVPYFIELGDHRDLTLTPYMSSETTTLEYRYRQAFFDGRLKAEGAFSSDTIKPAELRYYLFANGNTGLPLGYDLSYDIEATSDTAYLLNYRYSGKDRLDSAIDIRRIEHNLAVEGEFIHYQTLRITEKNSTQPTILAEIAYQKRIPDAFWGGELRLTADAHAHYRDSNINVVGRDVSRAHASAHWLRSGALENGLLMDLHGQLEVSAGEVAQDDTVDQTVFNVTPAIYSNFRWPLGKTTDTASFIFEPVVQFAWSDSVSELANEESTRVEFDEGNLLDFSRFPAPDRTEEGVRIAFGGSWTRMAHNGNYARFSMGRVIRDEADPDLPKTSGLQGVRSDWLVAGQLTTPDGLELMSRGLFNDDFEFSKAESRLSWNANWGSLNAKYIWLPVDLAVDRAELVSEVTLGTNINLGRHWTGSADWQYDIADERIIRAGLGIEYENECLDMRLAASRRFTDTSSVAASTDYDFRIGLRGFGAGRSGSDVIRTCGS